MCWTFKSVLCLYLYHMPTVQLLFVLALLLWLHPAYAVACFMFAENTHALTDIISLQNCWFILLIGGSLISFPAKQTELYRLQSIIRTHWLERPVLCYVIVTLRLKLAFTQLSFLCINDHLSTMIKHVVWCALFALTPTNHQPLFSLACPMKTENDPLKS